MSLRVSVFGVGYVGSVTAACLARAGHDVTAVDVSPQKVEMINAGTSPVVEHGLGPLLAEVVAAGRLSATTSGGQAIRRSDLALVCVGTPGRANGRLDVDAVAAVGREIGRALRGRRRPYTVVLRSTVLPGTTQEVLLPSLRAGLAPTEGPPLRMVFNPEFMREGSSLEDFARPPLTLVGCADAEGASLLRALYAGVEAPFVHCPIRTAEMVKYVSNAFHALKVCFTNEIADVCDALGADAQQVMEIFRQDRKLSLSDAYLRPGFAFGGSCLPKDVRALLYGARGADVMPPLLGAILPSNDAQIRRGVDAVLATGRRRVGLVGLSFKDGTDDLRESPLVTLVESLIGKGLDLRVLDRNVSLARLVGANRRYIEEQVPHIASLMCDDLDSLLAHADVLVIGNAGEDAVQAWLRADPRQAVVDLTRGMVRERAAARMQASAAVSLAASTPSPVLARPRPRRAGRTRAAAAVALPEREI
jgi:GDP-mannose 6-dehydrogenase